MNLDQLNIFNEPLEECSNEPKTGFFRTGCCETDAQDIGTHTVCAIMDKEFLQFSLHQGNDLITPAADFDFPGLKPGDKWCLCANRWLEAFEAGFAPHIIARATNIKTLDIIPLDKIKLFAIDIA
ncbi:MAG: DUF2237 family protein [Gammaproteobacteria bacterium]|nr:hypothetical protein [Gammaproteobacteria bacterium]|tara:strand:- start:416 stop:790 length:375 start_codon:yes stop_codon:yes gene_type:complete